LIFAALIAAVNSTEAQLKIDDIVYVVTNKNTPWEQKYHQCSYPDAKKGRLLGIGKNVVIYDVSGERNDDYIIADVRANFNGGFSKQTRTVTLKRVDTTKRK
ncbi:MAG: hypothetical protein IJL89_11725, partial [Firmicutes bacterium]|nr:hypothetical protein [Bacillota bacterium]